MAEREKAEKAEEAGAQEEARFADLQMKLHAMAVQKSQLQAESNMLRANEQAASKELKAARQEAEDNRLQWLKERKALVDRVSEQADELKMLSRSTWSEITGLKEQVTQLERENAARDDEIERLSGVEEELERLQRKASAMEDELEELRRKLKQQHIAAKALSCVYLRSVALLKRNLQDTLGREEQLIRDLKVMQDQSKGTEAKLLAEQQRALRERERLLNQVKLEVQRSQATIEALDRVTHERTVMVIELEERDRHSVEAEERLQQLRAALAAGEKQLAAACAQLQQEQEWYQTLVRLLQLCQGRLRELEGMFGSLSIPGGSAGGLEERRPGTAVSAVGTGTRQTLHHLASMHLGHLRDLAGQEKSKRLSALKQALEATGKLTDLRPLLSQSAPALRREHDPSSPLSKAVAAEGAVSPSSPLAPIRPMLSNDAMSEHSQARKRQLGRPALPRNASVTVRGSTPASSKTAGQEQAWTPAWHVTTSAAPWEELTEALAFASFPGKLSHLPDSASSPPLARTSEGLEAELHMVVKTNLPPKPTAFAPRPLLGSRSAILASSLGYQATEKRFTPWQ